MPDTPKRKPKTITAASKAKLPRPKRKRPKPTAHEIALRKAFEENRAKSDAPLTATDILAIRAQAKAHLARAEILAETEGFATTPSPLTATPPDLGSQPLPTFEAIPIGDTAFGGRWNTGTLCHDPIDEAAWRATALPHTAPEPFDLPLALLAIRRWLADRLTTLATFIRPTDA